MNVKQSKTFYLKNNAKKVIWSSSNKNISLSKKKRTSVKVYAKKAGKVTLYAKVGKKKYSKLIVLKAAMPRVKKNNTKHVSNKNTASKNTNHNNSAQNEAAKHPAKMKYPTLTRYIDDEGQLANSKDNYKHRVIVQSQHCLSHGMTIML